MRGSTRAPLVYSSAGRRPRPARLELLALGSLPGHPHEVPTVTFVPLGKSYEVRRGGSLLRAAIRARVGIARSCRGDAVCASCRVQVVAGSDQLAPPSKAEEALAQKQPLGANERYACQALVLGDVAITTSYW